MKWFAIIGLILLVCILVLLITRLTITIQYHHAMDNDLLKINFRIWAGLLKYTINVPLIKWEEGTDTFVVQEEKKTGSEAGPGKKQESKFTIHTIINKIHNVQELLQHVIHFHTIVKSFLKKVSVHKLTWVTEAGTGDASKAAILAGALWSVKGMGVGLISKYMNLQTEPLIDVHPSFQKAVIDTRLECMISFRIGHAIGAGFKVLKYWKGRRQSWQSIQFKA